MLGARGRRSGADWTVRPNPDGYFMIGDVPPGDYVLVVSRRGEIVLRRRITVRSGSTETLDLDVKPTR